MHPADAPSPIHPALPLDEAWIDSLTDEQCAEVFWLYVESPDAFLASHPAPLLGAAMRYALRCVARQDQGDRGTIAPDRPTR